MPTVGSATSTVAHSSTARTTDLLKVQVQENDPQLKASATPFGFKLSGEATNNGTKSSFLALNFDGQKVNLQVSRGDTGQTLFKKLQKKLPTGYQARILELGKSAPPQVTIGIARKSGGATALNPARVPTSIAANNAGAAVDASLFLDLMPGSPHPNAIASVTVRGTGFADAPPKFAVKSIDVYEKGTNHKVATIANPKLVDSQTRRGEKQQSYRLEVPRAKLDLNKQYTFVANTGINGARAQLVRSEYVKVGKAF